MIKKLAGGGMAEIYLATLQGAAGFEKDVVVKTILPQWSQHRDFIAMLVDEAKIAVRLDHPNIVSVYELAREGETYFIAMEYVPGWDARRLLQAAAARKQTLPLEAALSLVTEVLEGLAYAHEKKDAKGLSLGIVHRDVSPQNLLLSREGAVKITDFGIAKAVSKSHETATGVLKGKLAYMSPEQASLGALGEPDGRSDLFSAAVVLYELATGERLFYRGSDAATLDCVSKGEVAPSPRALQLLPKPLYEILRKALARLPDDRYRNAREFRKALLDFAASSGLDVRRGKLAKALGDLGPEEAPEEVTVVASGPTRTAVFAEDRAQTLVERAGDWERTVLLTEDTEKAVAAVPPPRSGRWIAAAVVGFVLAYAVTAGLVWLKSGKPPFPPPTIPSETQPETQPETEPIADLKSQAGISPVAALPVPAKGYLTVHAVPWGTVTVDGAGKRETPVRRLPLAAGRHSVRVRYEPDGSAVSATVTVTAGKEIVCVANFRSGKELTCGK
ncbi:MAG TPA: serine/threonine-protein kinase [bacterium]|nr:serine/threonine-protein kinase [bacterium]